MADPAIASSTLKQHYEEVVKQLNNPIVVARLLVLEGVFAEPDLDTVERKRSLSSQKDVFCKTLTDVIVDYEKLIIFAVILLKFQNPVGIGKTILEECGEPYHFCCVIYILYNNE